MATTNSDLKNFAVFVNSKASSTTNPKKSNVSIPFTSNLAAHENMKVFKFGLVDMLFTNSFYNIRPGVNTLKIMTCFAAGRNQPAAYVVQTVQIPYAFYSIDQLDEYLSQVDVYVSPSTLTSVGNAGTWMLKQLNYAGQVGADTHDVYTGFGQYDYAAPADSLDSTTSNPEAAKIRFNSPTLEGLTQLRTDLTTTPAANGFAIVPTAENNLFSDYTSNFMGSGIYAGVYLIADSDTIPLLKLFGFYSDFNPPSVVPLFPQFSGYGYAIKASTVTTTGQPGWGFNTVYSYVDPATGRTLVPVNTVDNIPPTTSTYLLPTLMTDLSGLDEVYVHCAQMRTSFLSSINRQPLTPSDVIAVIPINVSFGSKMSWVPNFQITATLLNTNITHLDFTLTNSNNELLDFNGINWSMTLYCQEEEDESRYQQEGGGSMATPFSFSKNLLDAGAYMQESHNRGLLKRQR
jgi:hypothetical protein